MNTYKASVNGNQYIISVEEMEETNTQKNKYCHNCGCEIDSNSITCSKCGYNLKEAQPIAEVDNTISAGLVILSFLIPIFGIVYWAINLKSRPKCAKVCGIVAIMTYIFKIIKVIYL